MRGGIIPGARLVDGLTQLMQVIDGQFEAVDEAGRRLVEIRAVDSSWWEVWSDDESIVEAIRESFGSTESASRAAG